MGLGRIYFDYIDKCAEDVIGSLRGKRMLELGNQHNGDESIPEKTGKEYYTNRGVEHISVDLNGMDGALKVDLSKPINIPSWQGYFDIITNCGTSQHVEPKKAQYICFMNIHNCLKLGGIAVHLVPDIDELKNKGCWKWLCNHYYSHEFFKMLAMNNDYNLVSLKVIDGNICACLQKKYDRPFMENQKEFLKYITRREWGEVYPGINDRGISMRLQGLIKRLWNMIRRALRPLSKSHRRLQQKPK